MVLIIRMVTLLVQFQIFICSSVTFFRKLYRGEMLKKTFSKGYTLIEMIVVVGIICVLTALAMPEMNGVVEKNNLREAESIVRQAIIDTRAMSLAPKGGDNGVSMVTGFETDFYTGITGATTIGENDPVLPKINPISIFPVMVRGIITRCDDDSKVLYKEERKNYELPEGVVIDGFMPNDPVYQDSGYDIDKYDPPKQYTGAMTALRFKLTDFSVRCGGTNMSASSSDTDFWSGGEQYFQIRLKNTRINADSTDQQYGYVNVNKYSGQVWISQEENSMAKVTVPKDSKDFFDLYAYSPDDSFGQIQIQNGTKSYIIFRMSDVNDFPKKARVWLTSEGSSGGKVKISVLEPTNGLYDHGSTADNMQAIQDYIDIGPSSRYVKTLSFDSSNSNNIQQSFDINLKLNKEWWYDGASYKSSRPLILSFEGVALGTNITFYTQEYQDINGKVCLDKTSPAVPSDCKRSVRPGAFVEFFR